MTNGTNIIQRPPIRLKLELIDDSCIFGTLVKIENIPDCDATSTYSRKTVVTLDSELLGTLDINVRWITEIHVSGDGCSYAPLKECENVNPKAVVDALMTLLRGI